MVQGEILEKVRDTTIEGQRMKTDLEEGRENLKEEK